MRALLLIHRYLGIGLGVLMVGWCLSGIVMMYVGYPALLPSERLRHLEPIDWRSCCVIDDAELPDDAAVTAYEVEMIATHPVLRVKLADAGWRVVDLSTGHAITSFTALDTQAVATSFDRTDHGPGATNAATPRLDAVITYDQWTVSGEFNKARPLYRFVLDDAAKTRLYVSSKTGKVVQVTNAHERFWNWLGAIPHWLYFAQLRRQTAVWNQLVIWTSLGGCFLTMIGLYIGVERFVRRPHGRYSPYRGVHLWHHVPGLLFGLFVLSWVGSGLVSMNPWGFLESANRQDAIQRLRGAPTSGAQVKASLTALAASSLLPDIVSVDSAPLWGQFYLVATTLNGARWRFSADGVSARMGSEAWAKIAQTLSDGGNESVAVPELVTEGDAYYFSRHRNAAQLPIYRIVLHDEQQTRYYLDPLSGTVVQSLDSNGRWYRWLHQGLHTLDFSFALRTRPAWDLLMLALLAGVTGVCATGAYLGLRRCLPR